MSVQSTLVTAEHFRYLAERTSQQDAFLTDLRRAAKATGLPEINIAPEQASFLQILLRLHKARDVIEVGTLGGYSAIAMARALPDGGSVRTIEIDAAFAEFARSWVARSDVSDRVEVFEGRGMDVLPTFETDSADAAFLDADKASYADYLGESLRIVRPGGLVCVDNAFAFGQIFDEHPTDPEVEAVKAFNDLMAKVEGLQSIIVPLGDGCWVGVKT